MIENKNPGNKTSGYYQTIAGIAYLLLSGFIYFNPKVIPMLQGEENAGIRLAIIAFFGIYGVFRVYRGVKILSE